MKDGKRIKPPEPLEAIRHRAAEQLKRLPAPLRTLSGPFGYPVTISDAIRTLAAEIDQRGTV